MIKEKSLYLREVKAGERDKWFLKNIQLYETQNVRHGYMLVGPTGCGKSEIFKTLTEALTILDGTMK